MNLPKVALKMLESSFPKIWREVDAVRALRGDKVAPARRGPVGHDAARAGRHHHRRLARVDVDPRHRLLQRRRGRHLAELRQPEIA